MTISIALTTFNGAKYLTTQLDSFAKQSLLPTELVVCDDCSSDQTLAILEDFKRTAPFDVHIYKNTHNIGLNKNFEKAISLCSGDLIFLSDQDDVWFESKLSMVCDTFNTHPEIDVVINDAMYADEFLEQSQTSVLEKAANYAGSNGGHIAGACTAFRSRFQRFLLPFPKECPPYDIYIHRFAWLLSNKLIVNESLQLWRIHGSNGSGYSEMASPKIESTLVRFWKQRHIKPSEIYLNKSKEYLEIKNQVINRLELLESLPLAPSIESLTLKLDDIIEAYEVRSLLLKANFFKRLGLIYQMIKKKQYQYFKGLQSIAKDILR